MEDSAVNSSCIKIITVCLAIIAVVSILFLWLYSYNSSYSREWNKQMLQFELEQKKNDRELQNLSQELKELKKQSSR